MPPRPWGVRSAFSATRTLILAWPGTKAEAAGVLSRYFPTVKVKAELVAALLEDGLRLRTLVTG